RRQSNRRGYVKLRTAISLRPTRSGGLLRSHAAILRRHASPPRLRPLLAALAAPGADQLQRSFSHGGGPPCKSLLGFGAFFGGLAFGADPGAHHDFGLVVAAQGPRDEGGAGAARAALGSGVGRKMRREPRNLGRHRRDDITSARASS